MTHCPICRAALNGADTCRRCRADLATVKRVAAEGQALVGLAMHHLSLDDEATAEQLLQRALALHATPAALALLRTMREPRNNAFHRG
jgi:hypothetical protein